MLFRSGATLLAVALLACTRTDADPPRADSASAGAAMPAVVAAPPAPAVTVPPRDPDDTAPDLGAGRLQQTIRYVPRARVAPACAPAGPALCLTDVAREWPEVDEGSSSPESNWLLSVAAGDSIELHAVPDSAHPQTTLFLILGSGAVSGEWRYWQEDIPGLTAPFLRMRFPATGSYVLESSLGGFDADTGTPYQLRVVAVTATERSRPSGAAARLVLVGDSAARIAVIPAWADAARTGARAWAVRPGDYQVLLGADSAYTVCRLPCSGSSQRVVLRAGQRTDLRW